MVPVTHPHGTPHLTSVRKSTVLVDELGALLGDILDTLSPEELGRLPAPIWAMLDFIAGTNASEAAL
jgi:hypothetical protein